MTDDRLALLELIEKRADADLIREMLGFAAGRVRKAFTRPSISATRRLTSLLDTPEAPSALTRSSTARVETPWM